MGLSDLFKKKPKIDYEYEFLRSKQLPDLQKAIDKLISSKDDYHYTPQNTSSVTDGQQIKYNFKSREPVPSFYNFICTNCQKRDNITIYDESMPPERIYREYLIAAQQFSQIGYPAKIHLLCDECADKLYPSRNSDKHNIVFAINVLQYKKPIVHYPSKSYFRDLPYRVTHAFLQGADTFDQLSKATKTMLPADDYLWSIYGILGNMTDGETRWIKSKYEK